MKHLIRSTSVAAAALVVSLGLAAAAAPTAFAASAYCTDNNTSLAIVAHADDDFYFLAHRIKPNIEAGHCFRVVHLTGGYANNKKPLKYQTRVDAALAGYQKMLGLPKSTQWTSTWDLVNGKLVLRYQTVLRWTATGPQTLEVQVVGLPCGYHDQGHSGWGVTLAGLLNDANASTTTIDGKGTSYNLAEVRAFLEQIFTEEQPSTIFTLDPYGSFFYNGHEGQHPDHIVTARLVQESGYVASHPTAVKYFKTYNLNHLPANLDSDGIIAKNEAMLGYVSVDDDPGIFTLGEDATDCSGLSTIDQLGDKGWLCKDYAAQDGTYFQAARLKLDDGRCLAVRNSDRKVTFATCTDTAYATDFSLDGQSQVFVGNDTRRRLHTWRSARSAVTAPTWDETDTDEYVSGWRYNPTNKTLQQTDPSNAQLICVAPIDTPIDTRVEMVDCSSGAALTVTRGAAAPTGVPLTLKNKVTGRCVLLSSVAGVSMGDCASSEARLKLNAAGQLASAASPNQCLQRREFQQRSPYGSAPCNSASLGQRFALTQVASGTDYTFVSHSPISCMEDNDPDLDLNAWECNNYERQLWQITRHITQGDLDRDGDVDNDDLSNLLKARNQAATGSNDPRDLDGDGRITTLDARKLILLCTRPRCATQ